MNSKNKLNQKTNPNPQNHILRSTKTGFKTMCNALLLNPVQSSFLTSEVCSIVSNRPRTSENAFKALSYKSNSEKRVFSVVSIQV